MLLSFLVSHLFFILSFIPQWLNGYFPVQREMGKTKQGYCNVHLLWIFHRYKHQHIQTAFSYHFFYYLFICLFCHIRGMLRTAVFFFCFCFWHKLPARVIGRRAVLSSHFCPPIIRCSICYVILPQLIIDQIDIKRISMFLFLLLFPLSIPFSFAPFMHLIVTCCSLNWSNVPSRDASNSYLVFCSRFSKPAGFFKQLDRWLLGNVRWLRKK